MTHGSPASRKALELLVRLYEILVRLAPPVEDRAVFCSAQHLCVCVCVWCVFLSTYIQCIPTTYTQVHTHTPCKVYKHRRTDAQTHTHTSWCSDPWQRWHCVHSREKVSCISLTCMCVCVSVYSLSLTIEEMRCHAIDMAKCLHAWTDRQQTRARKYEAWFTLAMVCMQICGSSAL